MIVLGRLRLCREVTWKCLQHSALLAQFGLPNPGLAETEKVLPGSIAHDAGKPLFFRGWVLSAGLAISASAFSCGVDIVELNLDARMLGCDGKQKRSLA